MSDTAENSVHLQHLGLKHPITLLYCVLGSQEGKKEGGGVRGGSREVGSRETKMVRKMKKKENLNVTVKVVKFYRAY